MMWCLFRRVPCNEAWGAPEWLTAAGLDRGFRCARLPQVMQAVIQREIPMDYGVWKAVSPECRDLIQAMLTRDPAQRISAADAMHHPWFRNFGIGAPLSAITQALMPKRPAKLLCIGSS